MAQGREDHAQVAVLLPGSFSHDCAWAEGTLLTGSGIEAAVQANRTVVLHNVELYWRPIGLLAQALHAHFGVYAQAPPSLLRTRARARARVRTCA